MRVTMQSYLYEMAELDQAQNKSARVQELITKGLMAERQENKINPPSRLWTGDLFSSPSLVFSA